MAIVDLKLPHHVYAIHIGSGLLAHLGELVHEVAPHERAALLADGNVFFEPFAQKAVQSLEKARYKLITSTVDPGEDRKNLDTVSHLYAVLADAHLERKSPVIALGGGVITDTVGFVAATYLRGVPLVQCPTTLVAMVDASVGGKTGVNLPQGKNLAGSFYQPQLVVIDTDTLVSLPAREMRCGLAECVKHAMIRDADLFDWTEQNLDKIIALDSATILELLERNVQIKANVVMADEKEAGERAHLNFGHTFAHAIEATSGYGHYHHGEAVALGMVAATHVAVNTGRIGANILDRLIGLLDRIGLPTRADDLAPTPRLVESMQHDKKVADGQVRLVLSDRIGAVNIVVDTPADVIDAAWDSLRHS